MIEIINTPARAVETMWPQVEPHLAPSIALTRGCFEPVDVMAACAMGEMQLWLVADGDDIVGAAVTEIRVFPRRRLSRVLFAGGKNPKRWAGELDKALDEWSRTWGCTAITAGGRKGWGRLIGAEEIAVELWKDLPASPTSQEIH